MLPVKLKVPINSSSILLSAPTSQTKVKISSICYFTYLIIAYISQDKVIFQNIFFRICVTCP